MTHIRPVYKESFMQLLHHARGGNPAGTSAPLARGTRIPCCEREYIGRLRDQETGAACLTAISGLR